MIADLLRRGIDYLSGTANPDQWLIDWVNRGEPSSSGEFINEENAMNCPAMKAAISILAESIQVMPIRIRKELKSGHHEIAADHEANEFFQRSANPEVGSSVWKHKNQIDLCTYGNMYNFIQRTNSRSRIVGLWQRSPKPEQTKLTRDKKGRLVYQLKNDIGQLEGEVPAEDMLHVPYFSTDGLIGKSPVRLICEAIGGNKAAERFANEVFKNGPAVQGHYTHPGKMSEAAYKRLKDSIAEQSQHGNRHKNMVLEEAMSYKAEMYSLEQMQMVEAREFLELQIAMVYRIAPQLMSILAASSISSAPEFFTEFVTLTLTPWMDLWTNEINRKILKPPYTAQFDDKIFLKADPVKLAAWYRTMWGIGYYSLNEIRVEEGENPIDDPNADEHFVPSNLRLLSQADQPPVINQGKAPSPGDGVTPADAADTPNPGGKNSEPGLTLLPMLGISPPRPGPPEPETPITADAEADGDLVKARNAAEDVLRVELTRATRLEANEARRAAKSPGRFFDKIDKLFANRAAELTTILEPAVRAVVAAGGGIGKGFSLSDELASVVAEHLAGKKEDLLVAAECQAGELADRVAAAVEGWTK